MKKIDLFNYKTEVPKLTKILPHGCKQDIVEETGERYTTVDNVWHGRTFKKTVVDAIVNRYNEIAKNIKQVKVA